MQATAKMWGARAGEARFKFCEQLKILMDHSSPLFIVVGHKLFHVSFKKATIDFIIIIVSTLFLYNIIGMPNFVASDELTLIFCPDLLFVMPFTCKV